MKICLVLMSALLFSGCTVVETEKYRSDDNRGIPYHLPKSIMAVELQVVRDDKKTFTDLTFKLEPKQVPDADIYYLVPKNNVFYTSDHTFNIENGLLSNISTKDTGDIGDVAKSLINSAINIYSVNLHLCRLYQPLGK